MKYLLISCGCAECSSFDDGPLIEMSLHDTFEEAKANSWLKDKEWREHPQGGMYVMSGQGDDWILEVPDTFVVKPVKKE